MKTNRKRLTAMILIAVLTISMLTGCGLISGKGKPIDKEGFLKVMQKHGFVDDSQDKEYQDYFTFFSAITMSDLKDVPLRKPITAAWRNG